MPRPLPAPAPESIAIIGMGCRFPGARDVEEFWRLLSEGREGLRDFSDEELLANGVSRNLFQKPSYVRRGADLNGMLDFEPGLFGLSPARAEQLSPQFRAFLRSVLEALEDAGYAEEPEDQRVGVFAGGGVPVYLYPHVGLAGGERLSVGSGNAADFLASRVAFTFGFSGPANSIQTACSTSLVAVNEACEAIWAGRCEMAVAGGASYAWLPGRGYDCERGLMYSQEGRCRVFDEKADGTIFSSGSGAVLLKPISAALRDGDSIHAVIRGGAVNNDGNRRRGYASPSVDGQAQVIREAMARAGVSPDAISLVEAHGTGTQKGDPVELEGLTKAWRESSERVGECPLGSVKSNIGHADAAAGIAGLIKVVLALKHRVIPATLHVDQPNPKLELESSPFRLATAREAWPAPKSGNRRIAAVSAFGLGGTNAHVLVEEAPAIVGSESVEPSGWQLLPFSARTREGLDGLLAKWSTFGREKGGSIAPADAAFTLQRGRRAWKVREVSLARNLGDVDAGLGEPFLGKVCERRPVFLFPGQGAQFPGMARKLWESDPVFREAFDRCATLLRSHLERPLESIVYPDSNRADAGLIHKTEFAQPALFAVGWSLAQRWMAWGIRPEAVGGHSIGEYVAATLAGVVSLEDALRLVAIRGCLMARAAEAGGPTAMAAVLANEERVEALRTDFPSVELAAINGSAQIVVGGPTTDLASFERRLEQEGIRFRRLKTSAAFHSQAMDSALADFEAAFEGVSLSAPKLPVLSNVTGEWLTDEEAVSPAYFAKHLRSTVRFADNLKTLLEEDGVPVLGLEIGPGRTLTPLAQERAGDTDHHFLSTVPGPRDAAPADRFALAALGECWKAGQSIDWEVVLPRTGRRRVPLPGTHFVEQTLLAEGAFPNRMLRVGDPKARAAGKSSDPSGLFHRPIWRESFPTGDGREVANRSGAWLWFAGGFSRGFEKRVLPLAIENRSAPVIKVTAAARFQRKSRERYLIRPGSLSDYRQLIELVRRDFGAIAGLVHFWSGKAEAQLQRQSASTFESDLDRGVRSLTWLARALEEGGSGALIPIQVVTRGLMKGAGNPAVPANHAIAASVGTIQEEFPQLRCRIVELPAKWNRRLDAEIARRFRGLGHPAKLVFRDEKWWQQGFESMPLPAAAERPSPVRDGGVYLFTGGLGGLARTVALDLAGRAKDVTLILLHRSSLPPRSEWEARAQGESREAERSRDLLSMEAAGAKVQLCKVDVADEADLQAGLEKVESECGRINGVFHTAGVLADGTISNRDAESLRECFAVKAKSAAVLARFFAQTRERRESLDRLVFFSSISSELSPAGQVDYAGANGWLDGFVESARDAGLPALGINWPAWREVGMAADTAQGNRAMVEELARHGISPRQGTDALVRLWQAGETVARCVVAPFAFADRHEELHRKRQPVIDESPEVRESEIRAVRDPLTEMVALWQAELKDPEIGPDDNYFDRGGDSVTAVRLLTLIRRKFGETPPMSQLLSAPTPRNLIEAMNLGATAGSERSKAEGPGSHLVPLAEVGNSQKAPVFCFHAIDGGVLFYRDLAERLSVEGRSVFAVESPLFHDSDEVVPESIEVLARRYLGELRELSPRGPRVFCGYSFGALVAYEAARLAIQEGEEIESIIMLDMFNPANVRQIGNVDRLRRHWKNSRSMRVPERVASLSWRVLRLAGWMFRHIGVSLAERFLWRDELRRKRALARKGYEDLIRTYRPEPVDCRTLLVATETAWDKFEYPDDLRGWTSCLRGEVVMRHVGGNHLEVFQQPHLEVLTDAMRRFLSERSEQEGKVSKTASEPQAATPVAV